MNRQQILLGVRRDGIWVRACPEEGSNLRAGDVLASIGGLPVDEFMKSFVASVSGNAQARRVQVEHRMLEDVRDHVDLEVLRQGVLCSVKEPLIHPTEGGLTSPARPPHRLVEVLPGGILYCNFTRTIWDNYGECLSALSQASSVVVDLRGWMAEELCSVLLNGVVDGGQTLSGSFVRTCSSMRNTVSTARPQYVNTDVSGRRWAILIDHRTLSGGEVAAATLVASTKGVLIGTGSAGAMGSLGRFYTTSGQLWFFSNEKFLSRDGRALIGIGLTPDIEVQPDDFTFVLEDCSIPPLEDRVVRHAHKYLLSSQLGIDDHQLSTALNEEKR